MITTVTLNAAIDKTYYLDRFQPGQVSRVNNMRAVPGGKGINVARVIRLLGEMSHAVGFCGGKNGEFIRSNLDRQGIPHTFIEVPGESRICLNIMEKETGTSTEILEAGPTVEVQQVAQLKEMLCAMVQTSKVIVFSGSLPLGVPKDLYRDLIEMVQAEGALSLLDTSGEALVEALKAKPYMIKPNEKELSALTGGELANEAERIESIVQLMEQGIRCVMVSLGAKGAAVGFEGQLYRVHAPRIEAVNPVGCGDSFTAAFAVGLEKKLPIEVCLQMATASGAANALTEEAGNVILADYHRLLRETSVERIN